MSRLTFIARGFSPTIWYFFYSHAQSKCRLIKTLNTLIYMWLASRNGGYVGRTTIIDGMPDLPHGFHGIHISRNAKIGKGCTIYQNVTIGGGKKWSSRNRF